MTAPGGFCPDCGRVTWEHHPLCSQPWTETPREAWLEEQLKRERARKVDTDD